MYVAKFKIKNEQSISQPRVALFMEETTFMTTAAKKYSFELVVHNVCIIHRVLMHLIKIFREKKNFLCSK